MTKKKDHITLNFSEPFLERLRKYATRHDMKLNAVLKKAFELLEDYEAGLLADPKGKDGDLDY